MAHRRVVVEHHGDIFQFHPLGGMRRYADHDAGVEFLASERHDDTVTDIHRSVGQGRRNAVGESGLQREREKHLHQAQRRIIEKKLIVVVGLHKCKVRKKFF